MASFVCTFKMCRLVCGNKFRGDLHAVLSECIPVMDVEHQYRVRYCRFVKITFSQGKDGA